MFQNKLNIGKITVKVQVYPYSFNKTTDLTYFR